MKKVLAVQLIIILVVGLLGVATNAISVETASLSTAIETVTVGEEVTITVDLGQSVSAAQFDLDYDSEELKFISKSKGTFSATTKKYGYFSEDDIEDLSSVTFTFEALKAGNIQVSVNELLVSKGNETKVPVPVANSATIEVKEGDVKKATLSTEKETVTVGEEVTITVDLGQSVSAAQFDLDYDSEELKFISKSKGTFSATTKKYGYFSEDDIEDLSSVTFTFEALKVGTVEVSVNGLQISKGNETKVPVPVANSAIITVKEEVPIEGLLGDTDGNGKITTKDAKMVLQHIVKKITLTDEQFARADADRNKKITTKDAKMILQHIVKKIDLSTM